MKTHSQQIFIVTERKPQFFREITILTVLEVLVYTVSPQWISYYMKVTNLYRLFFVLHVNNPHRI